ncbi:NIF3 [Cyberlindnera jadinii]|uniref:NIF3 protein n=1 Tax=Cyberlindnera jadinii (strain ATCC 18201 / CBS 1600 / BCRC 20928 / JCM 3617 / NBRC 0987 / NRRL Y-1542) TaxID=983966 RepID=A0A0H5C651_CYBJN|nr:NIF3 [Cyberlindnera jadinii]
MYKRVITSLEKKFPLSLAESWDNVGLLVPSATTATQTSSSSGKVLLTVDLTTSVVDEAVEKSVGLIVAYHPFIFKGIKSINLQNPQHVSLLKLIQAGIQVYCPHTAIDAARGGVNDWLVKGITEDGNIVSNEVIDPSKIDPNSGCGRIVKLNSPIALESWLPSFQKHLGVGNLLLATKSRDVQFQSVAVCAGSGAGVFAALKEDADLYITGELSHHEALMLKEKGKIVVCARHSATERGFLRELAEYIEAEVADAEVIISSEDCDPFEFAS